MQITPEIQAFINWGQNIQKKIGFAKTNPHKNQTFIIKFKGTLTEMSETLQRLEELMPDSMLNVINAGIDALEAADIKTSALKKTDRYIEAWAAYRSRKGRDGIMYPYLYSIRENKLSPNEKTTWTKVKIFELNINSKGKLSALLEIDSKAPEYYQLSPGRIQHKIKKMFMDDTELEKAGVILKSNPKEIDLLIKKMAVHYSIMTRQQSEFYKRKFYADTAALKLYSIAEAIIVNKDIKAAKLILSAKVIDQLPLTPNGRNYFTLRALHKIAKAWEGLKMDYPTLKSLEDVVHPDRLVIPEQEEGLRKYFIRTYVDDKFNADNYVNKGKKNNEAQEQILNEKEVL